jgi:hypothetical protein
MNSRFGIELGRIKISSKNQRDNHEHMAGGQSQGRKRSALLMTCFVEGEGGLNLPPEGRL